MLNTGAFRRCTMDLRNSQTVLVLVRLTPTLPGRLALSQRLLDERQIDT